MKKLKAIAIIQFIIMAILIAMTLNSDAANPGGSTGKNQKGSFKNALSVSPNPVKMGSFFKIEYTLEKETELYLIVNDQDGDISFFFTETFSAGTNNIIFNTAGMEAGKYTLSINSDDKTEKVKLQIKN